MVREAKEISSLFFVPYREFVGEYGFFSNFNQLADCQLIEIIINPSLDYETVYTKPSTLPMPFF